MNTINMKSMMPSAVKSPVWYPFDIPFSRTRLSIAKAEGIILTDIDGREYLDAVSGLWNTPLGYGVRSITDAVTAQLEKMQFCSLFEHTSSIAEEAAVVLLENTDASMSRVIWGNTGSESIECAIKLMRGYQKIGGFPKRTVILSMDSSYHGTHYGAISISGLEKRAAEEISPIVPDVMFLSPALADDSEDEKAAKTELALKLIRDNRDALAGIMIEPVLASAGVRVIDSEYIRRVAELCREYDMIVAFDEVTTGFYRTGSRYYFQSIGTVPDILCLSKAINNGCLPLSATVAGSRMIRRFNDNAWVLQHGTTMGGCPAALAAMTAADREFSRLAEEVSLTDKAEEFLEALTAALSHIDYIAGIRACGFMYSVVLDSEVCCGINDRTNIIKALQQSGVLAYPSAEGFTLMPAFCTASSQWREITDRISRALGRFA